MEQSTSQNIENDIFSTDILIKNNVLVQNITITNNNDNIINDNIDNTEINFDVLDYNANNNNIDTHIIKKANGSQDNNIFVSLTLNKLKNIKSDNLSKKIGIGKKKISKWKENIKNIIMEEIMDEIMNNKTINNKKRIEDKNKEKESLYKYSRTDSNNFENENCFMFGGKFVIKENKKWLNNDMPGISDYFDNEHMFFFKDLDHVLIDNLSQKERYQNKIKERDKMDADTKDNILKIIIENKAYASYNNNIIKTNDDLLFEKKIQIINEIDTVKETIELTRNDIIRKLIDYIKKNKIE